MALIQRLLQDVDQRGLRFSWGKGVTPGVAGWYSVSGQATGVWVLNANNESPSTRAYLVFYLADVAARLGADRVDRAARILESIPSLQPKIAAARATNWKKYPSLYLSDVATDKTKVEHIFDALTDMLATE